MTTTKYFITGANLLGEKLSDITIEDGTITAVTDAAENPTAPEGFEHIDAAGLIALPGLVDPHVHLREPGREDAETVETGSRAAALGGFTAVLNMANSMPVADTAGVVEQVYQLGQDSGWTFVQPIGAVTVGLAGEQLSEMGAMADSRAKVRVFSDDGICVWDPAMMRRALEYVKAFDGVIAQHAQEPRLTEDAQMNEGDLSVKLGLPGWPAVAEEAIIARDVLLTQHTNSRLHVCHVSTKGSVEIIRWAKSQGINVTAEATPHHLMLTEELVETFDPVYKVNPPLRREEDVMALRDAVADGTIDVIGTDHAPHTAETKCCEWPYAAMGMTGLETMLPIVKAALIDTGKISWADFARIASYTPAKIGNLEHMFGQEIAAGANANLILVDPEVSYTVVPEEHASKGRNSPYRGKEVTGKVAYTFYMGHPVVADAQLNTPNTTSQARH
ncbi:dihydroorotase [Micrococcoides hystricis]|uniref:Dihydroorotase n=1 Tax=Micrococcoides hystricis TaxID=1572761 RepID=A0ABV6P7M3_9MICC